MDAADLFEGLQGTGYAVAYDHFNSAQTPPFICYRYIESADIYADNHNYVPRGDYHVELYTNNKDPAAEAAVEAELEALELPFQKAEAFIETEQMYQILYQIRIMEGAFSGEQS